MSYTKPNYKRTPEEELLLRCLMVESAHQDYMIAKLRDMLGPERAKRQVPISVSANPLRKTLNSTATMYNLAAVSGMGDRLFGLLRGAVPPETMERYGRAGLVPMPHGLTEGGVHGGLRDALEYLQACEYVVVAVGWAGVARQPYIHVIRSCDANPLYDASVDPYNPIRIEISRQRMYKGQLADVCDVWDLLEPSLTVRLGDRDGRIITGEIPSLRADYEAGLLSGEGYWWRWRQGERKGQAYLPCVVYGMVGRLHRGMLLSEGGLEAGVMRTSAMTVTIDCGFPDRNVVGLKTGTDSDDQMAEGTALNPGDIRVWHNADETRPGTHWEFGPGADAEAMWRNSRTFEADISAALGFPVDYTSTGGAPLDHEVKARQQALSRWFGICRHGDVPLIERIAAVAGKALNEDIPETGYSTIYLEEVTEALEAAMPGDEEGTEEEDGGDEEDMEDDSEDTGDEDGTDT